MLDFQNIKSDNFYVIYFWDNMHNIDEFDPRMTSHLISSPKQIQLIKTLKKMEQQVKIYQQFLMKNIINFVNIKFLNNFWIESLYIIYI